MSILAWIAFGGVAGAIANLLDPHPNTGGLLGSVILGILGAMAGGFLANLIFGITLTSFNLTSLSISVLGSLLLLSLGRAFAER
jgi:uncharacterized membrane protein YeaQ/YmgE (transglycosylase-associated protein family)